MIKSESPHQLLSTIDKILPILKQRCQQSASYVFEKTSSLHHETIATLLEKVLYDFAEIVSRNCLHSMIANVLSIQNLKLSQGLSQIHDMYVHNQTEILGIYSKPSELKLSILNHFKENSLGKKQRSQQIHSQVIQEIFFFLEPSQQQENIVKQIKQFVLDLKLDCNCNEKEILQLIEKQQIEDLLRQIAIKNSQNTQQNTSQSLTQCVVPNQQQLISTQNIQKADSELPQLKKKKKSINTQKVSHSLQKTNDILIKEKIYDKILILKQNYCEIIKKLFREELKQFWFLNCQDQQIKEKVMECNYSDNQLEEEIQKCIDYLQQRIWKYDQACINHRSKVYYLCPNELLRQKTFPCNQCISNDKLMYQHQNHQIICKKHKQVIKYKLCPKTSSIEHQYIKKIKDDQKDLDQIFLCQECLQQFPSKQYALICSHHNQNIITYLCTQPQCIESDNFKICPTCPQKHQKHRKIKFDKDSMMEQLSFQDIIDFSIYQDYLIEAKCKLELNLLQKIKGLFVEKTKPTYAHLESILVDDNKKIEELVNSLLKEGRKEKMMILERVLKMKDEKYSELDKRNHLEVFNSLVEAELETMYKSITSNILEQSQRINKLRDISQVQIAKVLKNKYSKIFDIEYGDEYIVSPMRLNQVYPIHYSQIEQIVNKKNCEYSSDQTLFEQRRLKRSQFFKDKIQKILWQNGLDPKSKQSNQIIKLFIERQQYMPNRLNKDLSQVNKYQAILQNLTKSYNEINLQYQAKLKECLPWKNIVNAQLQNLKVIHIQYSRSKYCLFDTQKAIDAFAFFKLIHHNPQLKAATIKGVQLQNMQEFIKRLNPKNFAFAFQQKEKYPWMKQINSYKNLSLCISYDYGLHHYIYDESFHSQIFQSQVEDLLYFAKSFFELCQITVKIIFIADQWGCYLEKLLKCFGSIKRIKIELISIPQLLLIQLLYGLTSLGQISSLSFEMIKFSLVQGQYATYEIEQIFQSLFDNNPIKSLKLQRCKNFPAVPKVNNLQQITFDNVNFQNQTKLNQFLNSNHSLRQINLFIVDYEWCLEENIINQTQNLSIIYPKDVSFVMDLPSLPSKLKYLEILDDKQCITVNSLQKLFPKLINLSRLILQNINCGYQLLCSIPSPYLQLLDISFNKIIKNKDIEAIDSKWPILKYVQLFVLKLLRGFCSFVNLKDQLRQKWEINMNHNLYLQLAQNASYINAFLLLIPFDVLSENPYIKLYIKNEFDYKTNY